MKNRKLQAGFTAIEFVIVTAILSALTIGGGLLYIAYHFVMKFW